jgi:hypothetical protein
VAGSRGGLGECLRCKLYLPARPAASRPAFPASMPASSEHPTGANPLVDYRKLATRVSLLAFDGALYLSMSCSSHLYVPAPASAGAAPPWPPWSG